MDAAAAAAPFAPILYALALAAALGCGLTAGVFFAFSGFVMRALGRLPAPEGVAAMQAINRAVAGSAFLAVFLGTAVACLALLAAALTVGRGHPGAGPLAAGGAAYLLGTFGVTAAASVPLNDALDRLDPASEAASAFWPTYRARWGAWNHARAASALLALALLAAGGWAAF